MGAAVLILALLTGSGCSQQPEKIERLVAAPRPYEPDVPIPSGFRIVDDATEDRSTGTMRLYLRHVYTGAADKYAVRNFYREQMPLARWSKVSDGNVRGLCTLRFVKGNESCVVEIGDASQFKTRIQVLVSLEQRGNEVSQDTLRRIGS
jgi:hypothetical protein